MPPTTTLHIAEMKKQGDCGIGAETVESFEGLVFGFDRVQTAEVVGPGVGVAFVVGEQVRWPGCRIGHAGTGLDAASGMTRGFR
ncbi:UNVERIFIED_ORG: hypothetical protein ABIB19_003745 [Arthrobacter sp. UYEF10]